MKIPLGALPSPRPCSAICCCRAAPDVTPRLSEYTGQMFTQNGCYSLKLSTVSLFSLTIFFFPPQTWFINSEYKQILAQFFTTGISFQRLPGRHSASCSSLLPSPHSSTSNTFHCSAIPAAMLSRFQTSVSNMAQVKLNPMFPQKKSNSRSSPCDCLRDCYSLSNQLKKKVKMIFPLLIEGTENL